MVILCNVAKWNKDNISILAGVVYPNASVIFTSPFKCHDELGVIDDFENNFKERKFVYSQEDRDIILRCRVLRLLDNKKALCLVGALRNSITKILISRKVNVVITELVDQYFHDVLVREARKLNIFVISPVQTFVNGYCYGENITSRRVNESEVNDVFEYLNNQIYEPKYITNLKVSNNLHYAHRIAKNVARYVYFGLLSKRSSNRNIYHYLASSVGLKKYASLFSMRRFKVTRNYMDYFCGGTSKFIYIPLQFYPEATIDYWCKDISVIDYENSLLKLIENLSGKFKIVLKDHPASLGFRNPDFIKRVNKLLNQDIFFVPTDLPSNLIVERVDAVVVWTGSVGFEAAFRSKPVFVIGEPYYVSGPFFKKVSLNSGVEEFEEFIVNFNRQEIGIEDKRALVNNLLSGFLKGFFRNDGTFDKSNNEHIREIMDLGQGISNYLNKEF